jgi:hypothetical protein
MAKVVFEGTRPRSGKTFLLEKRRVVGSTAGSSISRLCTPILIGTANRRHTIVTRPTTKMTTGSVRVLL